MTNKVTIQFVVPVEKQEQFLDCMTSFSALLDPSFAIMQFIEQNSEYQPFQAPPANGIIHEQVQISKSD